MDGRGLDETWVRDPFVGWRAFHSRMAGVSGSSDSCTFSFALTEFSTLCVRSFYMGEGPPPTNLENTSLYLGNSGRLDSQCHRFPVYGISSQDNRGLQRRTLLAPTGYAFRRFS